MTLLSRCSARDVTIAPKLSPDDLHAALLGTATKAVTLRQNIEEAFTHRVVLREKSGAKFTGVPD